MKGDPPANGCRYCPGYLTEDEELADYRARQAVLNSLLELFLSE